MELTPEILTLARQTYQIPSTKLENPVLIQMVGLPAWGKTFLSEKIAHNAPIVILQSDRLRKQLFPQATFTEEENRFLFDQVTETLLAELANARHSIILDMNVARRIHRTKNRELARKLNLRELTILTRCSDRTALARLTQRQKNPWTALQKQEYVVQPDRYRHFKQEIQLPGLLEKHWTFNSEKNETAKFNKLIAYLNN